MLIVDSRPGGYEPNAEEIRGFGEVENLKLSCDNVALEEGKLGTKDSP
jgi:hypothetical protein